MELGDKVRGCTYTNLRPSGTKIRLQSPKDKQTTRIAAVMRFRTNGKGVHKKNSVDCRLQSKWPKSTNMNERLLLSEFTSQSES